MSPKMRLKMAKMTMGEWYKVNSMVCSPLGSDKGCIKAGIGIDIVRAHQ